MEDAARAGPTSSKTGARLAMAVFAVAVLGIAIMALPRGFDTDLAKIGAGKPALVFVYDPNLMVSNQQTREMDALREALGDTVHFLIADVGRPEAQPLMQRHQAERTHLMLFAPDGRLAARMQAPVTAAELQRAIATVASP